METSCAADQGRVREADVCGLTPSVKIPPLSIAHLAALISWDKIKGFKRGKSPQPWYSERCSENLAEFGHPWLGQGAEGWLQSSIISPEFVPKFLALTGFYRCSVGA